MASIKIKKQEQERKHFKIWGGQSPLGVEIPISTRTLTSDHFKYTHYLINIGMQRVIKLVSRTGNRA